MAEQPPPEGLFGDLVPLPRPGRGEGRRSAPPEPASRPELSSLASALPTGLRLGTSSWSFPGWRGLVYRDDHAESRLARDGLAAYARHPLLATVGVDKTYYRPADATEYARLASQVPTAFRFLVKAWRGLVDATDPFGGGAWLDPKAALGHFVEPAVEGLGEKAGPLLFQFPPMGFRRAEDARPFVGRLRAMLEALPRGPIYAVEVRDRALVGPELGETLAATGAVPCLTVHPTMPAPHLQSQALALDHGRPLVMRWMLRPNHGYNEAKDLYAPFDRVVEPDDASRDELAALARAALGAGLDTWIVVNNKAEGSSPRSVERLAEAIVRPTRA